MQANITFLAAKRSWLHSLRGWTRPSVVSRSDDSPVEVHLVDLGVVVLDLGVRVADEDGEVGQAALQGEHLGEAADVLANAVHQSLDI